MGDIRKLGIYVVVCTIIPSKLGYRPNLVVKINGAHFDVYPGNWIVKDIKGNFYIYSSDDFDQLFVKESGNCEKNVDSII